MQANHPRPASEPVHIGERVEWQRRALRMKQETLAQLCNLSQSTVSRIERGELVPDAFQRRCLAQALQCEL